ncbi:MAG: hypothetical protein AAF327_22340, partial [Cyanobacteria bacterium P01_A01_bin.37]
MSDPVNSAASSTASQDMSENLSQTLVSERAIDHLPPNPLGIKRPLLGRQPIGIAFIQPKFITPLGNNALGFKAPGFLDDRLSNQNRFHDLGDWNLREPMNSAASDVAGQWNSEPPALSHPAQLAPDKSSLEYSGMTSDGGLDRLSESFSNAAIPASRDKSGSVSPASVQNRQAQLSPTASSPATASIQASPDPSIQNPLLADSERLQSHQKSPQSSAHTSHHELSNRDLIAQSHPQSEAIAQPKFPSPPVPSPTVPSPTRIPHRDSVTPRSAPSQVTQQDSDDSAPDSDKTASRSLISALSENSTDYSPVSPDLPGEMSTPPSKLEPTYPSVGQAFLNPDIQAVKSSELDDVPIAEPDMQAQESGVFASGVP